MKTWALHIKKTTHTSWWPQHTHDPCIIQTLKTINTGGFIIETCSWWNAISIWAMKNPSWAQHINHCQAQRSNHYCSFQRLHSDLFPSLYSMASILCCSQRKWSFMAFHDFLELAQEMIESQFLRSEESRSSIAIHTLLLHTKHRVCWERCFLWR